jgi:phage shock protein B
MNDVLPLLVVPMIIFMLVVAPVWLVLHYRSQRKMNQGLSQDEAEALVKLTRQATAMGERIKTLETILDDEMPDWRKKDKL